MAAPLNSAKKTVDLSAPGVRGSRIRRNPPPPPEKVLTKEEIREREARRMILGISSIALAMSIIIFFVCQHYGWSMGDYTYQM